MIRRRKTRSLRNKKGLLQFAKNIKSQHGEDGIIEKLIQILIHPKDKQLYCVDIGAWDGEHLSNTYALTLSSRWTGGLFVEADEERFKSLRKLYKERGSGFQCANVKVTCEEQHRKESSLDALFRTYDVPKDLTLISIDVDGIDYWLLNSIMESEYRPRIVVVEFNPTIPHSVIYITPKSDTIRHGSSLAAFDELMHKFKYVLVETTTYNAFFVPLELYERSKTLQALVPDTSIEVLNEISMGTSLYQLYDGTLKLAGCKKLLWHRIPIDEDKIQMLDKASRDFPFKPSEKMECQCVFAYGTLRPDFRGDGSGDKYGVTNDKSSCEFGFVRGFRLFQDKGCWYPFCVESDESDRVCGYCIRWDDSNRFKEKLAKMDRIEGSTYQRKVVDVECDDGKSRRAYIYFQVRNDVVLDRVLSFPEGDWLKATRRKRKKEEGGEEDED